MSDQRCPHGVQRVDGPCLECRANYHRRRVAKAMENAEYRAEYESALEDDDPPPPLGPMTDGIGFDNRTLESIRKGESA